MILLEQKGTEFSSARIESTKRLHILINGSRFGAIYLELECFNAS